MPLTKSAKKKLRKDKKRTQKNLDLKIEYKKVIKKTKKDPSKKNLSKVSKVLDKASKKGLMHKNKAARLKSRFAKSNKTTSITKPNK